MLFLLWYVYKRLFDLFVKKYLLAMYFFFLKKKKKNQLWSYGQQCSTFYKQTKNLKNKNLTYISLWWASLSPNLLMFILVLSLNAEFNG